MSAARMAHALKQLKRRDGFTLVEVLIAATLTTIVLGMALTMYISQQRNFLVGNEYIDIHQDARLAMDWLANDIRWGIAVESSYGGYSTSNSCIVLKVPSIDSSGDVVDINSDFDYIIYRLAGSNPASLKRRVYPKTGVSSRPSEDRLIAENIGSLTFSYGGTGLSSIGDLTTVTEIESSLVTLGTVGDVNLSDRLETRVKLRNKG